MIRKTLENPACDSRHSVGCGKVSLYANTRFSARFGARGLQTGSNNNSALAVNWKTFGAANLRRYRSIIPHTPRGVSLT